MHPLDLADCTRRPNRSGRTRWRKSASALISLASLVVMASACPKEASAPPAETQPAVQGSDEAPAPAPAPEPEPDHAARADELAHRFIVLDGHVDLPMRLRVQVENEGKVTELVHEHTGGNFDAPRARTGGLDAPFMSIYVPASLEKKGAKKYADGLIDIVEGLIAAAPETFATAHTPAQVRANFEAGKISLPMGMENGAPIEGKLKNLRHFYDRGIRYITLAHSKDNHISDSSYDQSHTHKGLSKFGKQVVAEMNRLGIMVDVSHISDDAFWQVIELSTVPVIASHSSCRHFTPGFERNMSDEMIQALADKGGVIQINFGSGFLDQEVREARDARSAALAAQLVGTSFEPGTPAYWAEMERLGVEYDREHGRSVTTVEKVADHIDHVVKLVGVDHVGLGSDYDGVGDSLPEGLEDVSTYPRLLEELLRRGYADADIEKICGGNVLRVWDAVEAHGAAHRDG